jgi:hypothetical protein
MPRGQGLPPFFRESRAAVLENYSNADRAGNYPGGRRVFFSVSTVD